MGYLEGTDSAVVFSHNDVNTGNILLKHDKGQLIFVDYEFSAYNYRAFDIANHFNEWTYDYSKAEFPYYRHNRSSYPSPPEQVEWLRTYLQTLKVST